MLAIATGISDQPDHPQPVEFSNRIPGSATRIFIFRVWLQLLFSPRPAAELSLLAQWHQWLRYTRSSPPSLAEQQLDTVRQIELKRLARAADERWASKPSVLDKPRVDEGQLAEEGLATAEEVRMDGDRDRKRRGPEELNGKQEKGPWKEQQGNPGERWQPQTWSPGISNSNNNL